ncbi:MULTISPECIES: DUF1998 domain-containing protein [unclassified Rhodococcus (in: high G+C Gram-positive bacteria)]|uniref:DUF1998 domain-containing protein n=1 Tax=unclassified Rhodococcus (in: high G+C Gram-positive bacteria) TaxID=192944 RepID=UPI001CBEE44A|nr:MULTISPECIES: DUF1998 domain-containing protein [unclassified Rhodococcus (in: high G+C Gram-positive bacteria)]
MRLAQTVTPYGVGAILDVNGESFVAADTTSWTKSLDEVNSQRLRALLGGSALVAAHTDDSDRPYSTGSGGVPYIRFPGWLFCKTCRRMVHWHKGMEERDKVPRCSRCKTHPQLVPMRIVQACASGHLDDVDWQWYTHFRGTGEHRKCEARTELYFEAVADAPSAGLEGVAVRCKSCGAVNTLAGITAANSLGSMGFSCRGSNPWDRGAREPCDEVPRALQRGASNLYYPTVWTSIEVPYDNFDIGESDAADVIRKSPYYKAVVAILESGLSLDDGLVVVMTDRLVADVELPHDFVVGVLKGEFDRPTAKTDAHSLIFGEWSALCAPDGLDTEDFKSRRVNLAVPSDVRKSISTLAENHFDSVVLVDKLREVRVLEGFHRIAPGRPDGFIRADGRTGFEGAVSFSRLPASEVFGEGIFLSLDAGRLEAWERRPEVQDRVRGLSANMQESHLRQYLERTTGPVLIPRFVLLHTLAHLLIRRLAFESGYGVSSLRERLYARSTPDGSPAMSGVLIYTAAGDSEGTLGGLVRQGESPNLLRVLLEALHEAAWCSSDPLCSEQRGTGFDGLGHAACHACTFASETSCECGNHLLDRLLVVDAGRKVGYFDELVDQSEAEALSLVNT